MPGKGFIVFFAILVALSLTVSSCAAVTVDDSQERIVMVIERGNDHQFPLLLENIDHDIIVTAEGDAAEWISFGSGKEVEYEIHPTFARMVLVNVDVPDGTELGEYDATILAGSEKVSDIVLKVTLELSDVRAYEELSDVDTEVGSLKERVESLTESMQNMRKEVTDLQKEVSDKMQEIYQYQKDLSELENDNDELETELSSLREKSQELEDDNERLNDMTGMMIGTQIPAMFFGGILIGVLVMVVVVKREIVKRKIRKGQKASAPKPSRDKSEEKFRYSYTGS